MICPACHTPYGLHTLDCHKAFRAAYDKCALEVSQACEALAAEYTRDTKHAWASAAYECARLSRAFTGKADEPA